MNVTNNHNLSTLFTDKAVWLYEERIRCEKQFTFFAREWWVWEQFAYKHATIWEWKIQTFSRKLQ